MQTCCPLARRPPTARRTGTHVGSVIRQEPGVRAKGGAWLLARPGVGPGVAVTSTVATTKDEPKPRSCDARYVARDLFQYPPAEQSDSQDDGLAPVCADVPLDCPHTDLPPFRDPFSRGHRDLTRACLAE